MLDQDVSKIPSSCQSHRNMRSEKFPPGLEEVDALKIMTVDVLPIAGSNTKCGIGEAAVTLFEDRLVARTRESKSAATIMLFNLDLMDESIFIPHFFS